MEGVFKMAKWEVTNQIEYPTDTIAQEELSVIYYKDKRYRI